MAGRWDIQIAGFGPFERQTSWSVAFDKPHAALYAGNGQGKTCLSRLLRATEVAGDPIPDTLVSWGCEQGSFLLGLIEDGTEHGALSVRKTVGLPALVDDQSGLLFHVFNHDYVQDNLAERHYAPSGDIRGYVMGDYNVKLDKDRQQLKELGARGTQARRALEQSLALAREDLKALGISPRIKEFADLSVDKVLTLDPVPDAYDTCLTTYQALRNLPDNPQVDMVLFSRERTDFDEIRELLSTPYTRELFSEAFLVATAEKRTFVATGLTLMQENVCPFCGQTLGTDARALIHLYEDYLHGQEALIVETLESEAHALSQLKAAYRDFSERYRRRLMVFRERSAVLGKTSLDMPALPSPQELSSTLNRLCDVLRAKANDISTTFDRQATDEFEALLADIDGRADTANKLSYNLNQELRKASKTLRETKRALCREAALRVRLTCRAAIDELQQLRAAYGQLRAHIRTLEAQGNQSKRELVADSFERMLAEVFGGKYRFDRSSFSLTYRGVELGESAEQVLSDGEKVALALCYFLASTAELLETQADAQRLFFVIDDPTDGLDQDRARRIASVLGRLEELLGVANTRLLVLTHDATCLHILREQGVVAAGYVLQDGALSACT